jgi:hypothetical protein
MALKLPLVVYASAPFVGPKVAIESGTWALSIPEGASVTLSTGPTFATGTHRLELDKTTVAQATITSGKDVNIHMEWIYGDK